jgi:hypothetical protein
MAIMRCDAHEPKGRTRTYAGHVDPVGFPDTALVCGATGCTAPALIWLETEEKFAYDRGERVFNAFTDSMKVRAR